MNIKSLISVLEVTGVLYKSAVTRQGQGHLTKNLKSKKGKRWKYLPFKGILCFKEYGDRIPVSMSFTVVRGFRSCFTN